MAQGLTMDLAVERGRAFHQTLTAYLGEASHPEDPAHDAAVGEALLAFGRGMDPANVVAVYNSWAAGAGYAPIRWLGEAPASYPAGTQLVDIQSAVLAVGRDGYFVVVQPPAPGPQATGTLRARVLPPAEWDAKLLGTSLEANRPDPQYSFIVVVEQGDQVIACWTAISAVHLERLWQSPAVRGGLRVTKKLLHAMFDQLLAQGVSEVLTNADTPEVEALLLKVGAHALPGQTWVIPLPDGKEPV